MHFEINEKTFISL